MSMYEIAREALEFASAVDHSFPKPTDARIEAWAAVFDEQPVWSEEARVAVREFYAKSGKRLTPSVIVDYCKAQPVWSSEEHINWWLNTWCCDYPYSPALHDYAGVRAPDFDEFDPRLSRTGSRERLSKAMRQWVDENRQTLIDAITTRRHTPPIYQE